MAADVVRTLQLAAVGALCMSFDLKRMMAATHATTGRRGLSLGDGHGGYASFWFCIGTPAPRVAASGALLFVVS
ncbi:hypothetical protein AA103581_2395 [Gluconobacter wancherniae NBRC 103581]|nr:hypothetical protein AA103581_2395 [Gluconobacter wancherniae NBRC 103581]